MNKIIGIGLWFLEIPLNIFPWEKLSNNARIVISIFLALVGLFFLGWGFISRGLSKMKNKKGKRLVRIIMTDGTLTWDFYELKNGCRRQVKTTDEILSLGYESGEDPKIERMTSTEIKKYKVC